MDGSGFVCSGKHDRKFSDGPEWGNWIQGSNVRGFSAEGWVGCSNMALELSERRVKIWRDSFGGVHALERGWFVTSTRSNKGHKYHTYWRQYKNQLRLPFCTAEHTRLILKWAGQKLSNIVLSIWKQPFFIAALGTQGILPQVSDECWRNRDFIRHMNCIFMSCPCLLDGYVLLYFTHSHPLSEIPVWFFGVFFLFMWLLLDPWVSTTFLFYRTSALAACRTGLESYFCFVFAWVTSLLYFSKAVLFSCP